MADYTGQGPINFTQKDGEPTDQYQNGWSENTRMKGRGGGVEAIGGAPADPGRVRDGRYWGGYGATVNPDGTVDMGGGRQADVDRYRGMAEQAAGREAYKTNYGLAEVYAGAGNTMRNAQGDAMGLYRDAARGRNSQAQALGAQMIQQGVAAQQGAALSTRGGGLAQAAALRRQQQAQGAFVQTGRNNLAALQAQEMATGRAGFMGAATQRRDQDTAVQGLHQEQAINQAKNEMAQRERNDQAQQAYEGLAYGVNAAAQQAGMAARQTEAGMYEAAMKRQIQSNERDYQIIGAGMSAAGSLASAAGRSFDQEEAGGPTFDTTRGTRSSDDADRYTKAVTNSDVRTKVPMGIAGVYARKVR